MSSSEMEKELQLPSEVGLDATGHCAFCGAGLDEAEVSEWGRFCTGCNRWNHYSGPPQLFAPGDDNDHSWMVRERQ